MPTDPKRLDRVRRYQKVPPENSSTAEGVNAVGMVCSLVGLLIKVGSILKCVCVCVSSACSVTVEMGSMDWRVLLSDLYGEQ